MNKVSTKKKPTVSKLKKKLDAIYSQYIRQKYSDDTGEVSCYTCPRRDHYKNLQCGHFVPRQYLKTRWDERNTRPQCYACNMLYNGQPSRFAANLVAEYGQGIVEELERNRMIPVKLDVIWYMGEIEKYKELLDKQG